MERFSKERPRYEEAAKEVAKRVQEAADEAEIKCTVTPRAKDVRSFHKKIFARGYADPWEDVTDKAGVRAVVSSAREVDELQDRIQLEFGSDLLRVEDKRQVTDPAKLAYSGLHVQVIAQHETNDHEAIECEIQLRTAAQDAWSIVSHRLLYKPVLSLPPKLQHAMYRLVALVEMFDEEVQRIIDELPNLPGSEVVDLLDIAEGKFLSLAHSPSNSEVSLIILQAIAGSIDEAERANYEALLTAFVDSEHDRLEELYKQYGAHSVVSYVPSYLLFGQAESLILLERLNTRPHALAQHWSDSGLPEEYLDSLAGAAGVDVPWP